MSEPEKELEAMAGQVADAMLQLRLTADLLASKEKEIVAKDKLIEYWRDTLITDGDCADSIDLGDAGQFGLKRIGERYVREVKS